jgi:uncharacterized protein YkwD
MKCRKCGFPYFDRKSKCLFCGEEAPIDARPPAGWSSEDWHSSPRTKPVPTHTRPAPKESNGHQKAELFICARCHERSLFLNKLSGIYECVNRECPSNQRQSVILDNWRKPIPQQASQCPRCGSPVVFGVRFCANCGIYLNWQPPQPPSSPQTKSRARETKQPSPRTENSYRPPKKPQPRGMRISHGTRNFFMSVAKLLLCLLVIAGIGITAWTGYSLFTHQIDSIISTIVFLTEIGILIWIMRVLQSSRFRWRRPSFKLVFWPLAAITLVCAFAGIEPMSSAKDKVVSFIEQSYETIMASSQSATPAPVQPPPELVKPPSNPAVPSTPASPSSSSPSNSTPSIANTRTAIDISKLEMEIHSLINIERQGNNLPSLEYDIRLAEIARNHSLDMATQNYFDHYNLTGQGPTERAKAAGYNCYKNFGSYYSDGIAENIFQNWLYNSTTYYYGIATHDWNTQEELASSTVNGWMNSSGHRQNILNPGYSKEGIGVAISNDDKVLITQDFW